MMAYCTAHVSLSWCWVQEGSQWRRMLLADPGLITAPTFHRTLWIGASLPVEHCPDQVSSFHSRDDSSGNSLQQVNLYPSLLQLSVTLG